MAQLDEVFDPSVIEDTAREHTPLPVNVELLVQITGDEMKATKKGTGKMINFALEIIDGPHTGRKFWERINWTNQSMQAQTIGRELLKKITEAILGVGATINDTDVLHYKPFVVVLKATEAKGDYAAGTAINKDKVRSVKSGVTVTPPKPANTQAAAPAAPAGARAPWPARTA